MPVTVRTVVHEDSLRCTGAVRAEPLTEPGSVQTTLLGEDGTAAIQLPVGGSWQFSLSSAECWAAPRRVDFDADPAREVAVQAWPKAEVSGVLRAPSHEELPSAVELELRRAPARGGRRALDPLGRVACAVLEERFRCDVPQTDLDLRIAAEGFAPVYIWNLKVASARATLPAVSLERGASISGWVEDAGGDPVSGAKVQVVPQHVSEEAGRVSGIAAQTVTVSSNERGFFQVRSIPDGEYAIAARTDARAVAAPREISIRQAREHSLAEPLVTESPARVQVQIDPPLTPDRQRWNVQLSRAKLADRALERVASGSSDELGRWRAENIERGPYEIALRDGTGAVVARQIYAVDRDSALIEIRVGEVPMEGRVRLGGKPIAAELKFSSATGSIRVVSAADGTFAGWLPNEGPWTVQITPDEALQRVRTRVDVRIPPNEMRAQVPIDLPGGRIEGTVVDEESRPVANVEILVLKGTEIAANGGSDGEGRFAIVGLEPGSVVLYAKTRDLFSDHQPYTVSAASATEQTLVLRAPAERSGRLVRASGAPVVGALIRYFRGDELLTTVSGPTGAFTLALSPGVLDAEVVIVAPNTPVVLDRIRFAAKETAVVIPDVAAVLRIVPHHRAGLPSIAANGVGPLPLAMLFLPRNGFGPPREVSDGAIELQVAPGRYSVCYAREGDCVVTDAPAGAVSRVAPPRSEGGAE